MQRQVTFLWWKNLSLHNINYVFENTERKKLEQYIKKHHNYLFVFQYYFVLFNSALWWFKKWNVKFSATHSFEKCHFIFLSEYRKTHKVQFICWNLSYHLCLHNLQACLSSLCPSTIFPCQRCFGRIGLYVLSPLHCSNEKILTLNARIVFPILWPIRNSCVIDDCLKIFHQCIKGIHGLLY
jgi:hypothetical protein